MAVPDILAVFDREHPSERALHHEVCAKHVDAALAEIVCPFTPVEGVTVLAVSRAADGDGGDALRLDGEGGNISWPVIVSRPPVLASDPAGEWAVRTVEQGDGRLLVETTLLPARALDAMETVVGLRRFRYDPQAALTALFVALTA